MHSLSQFLQTLPKRQKVIVKPIFDGESKNSIYHQCNKINLSRAQFYEVERLAGELSQVEHILKTVLLSAEGFNLFDKKPLVLAAYSVHGFIHALEGAMDSDTRRRGKGGVQ